MPLQPKALFFYSQIFIYENGATTISISDTQRNGNQGISKDLVSLCKPVKIFCFVYLLA
jgi:hypothetical protein